MTKEELMRRAIVLSVDNVRNGGGPFGAVITRNGEVVATGVNRVTATTTPPPMQRCRPYGMRQKHLGLSI